MIWLGLADPNEGGSGFGTPLSHHARFYGPRTTGIFEQFWGALIRFQKS